MTARPDPSDFAFEAFLRQHDAKDLLRLVVCGSVDHGKSTLIGRLLYEAGLLLDDHLAALAADSRKYGTQGKDLDFSLVLDGLAAEREQKITIDVAYRYFATARRKFIVADAPGHEQYTRNMATGASTADLALLLVSAQSGLTRQTKRHSAVLAGLGIRQFVVAVNKMDLVDWSQRAFRAVADEIRALAEDLGVDTVTCIPVAARTGDNVVARSPHMPWYAGPTLLRHLEEVEVAAPSDQRPFRFPVQLVNRPTPEFRGYSGMITSGDVFVGMPVRICPSGQRSYVERIVTFDGDVERATAGQSVTLTLADDVDVTRGAVIADAGDPPAASDHLAARIVWMGREPLVPGRSYLFKLATCSATATVEHPLRVLDLDTRRSTAAERLHINDLGSCVLRLDRPVACDPYAAHKGTGSFILIDPESFDTIGMGMVEAAFGDAAEGASRRGAWRRRAGLRPAPGGGDSPPRSIAKALSWRAVGSLTTFVVALILTGSPTLAGSVVAAEIVAKIAFYYCHERIWALISWGRSAGGTDGPSPPRHQKR
jgi:sulfate adenylyltransferase large subunit